ncbi:MAG: cation-translocating P-type ATPase [candidate division KSB1 bacterium]|nr:cation-translocating P-type ATPase [candidate division KSB1 bacterium]
MARLLTLLQARRGILKAHVKREGGSHLLCLHYDPSLTTLSEVRRLVRKQGAAIANRYRHATLHISDMDCADCAQSIEHILRRMDGLIAVSVSYPAEKMRVEYDAHRVSLTDIVRKVRQLGYSPETPEPALRSWLRAHLHLISAVASGFFLGMGMSAGALGLPRGVATLSYLLAYLLGGWDAARHGVLALLRLRLEIDLLMVAAAIAAAALGHYPEGGLLLFLFSLGHSLEHLALQRVRSETQALQRLRPATARVRRNGALSVVPVQELRTGDVVLVPPGERVPVDGKVLSGTSDVDESVITGESLPVGKGPGDWVLEGSLNSSGLLEVEVTRVGGETAFARIVQLIEEAQTQKARVQRSLERFQRVYVPLALVGVIGVAIVPPIFGWLTWKAAGMRAIAVLVAASPCALALAVPATILSALARAARQGILVKGGAYLEALGKLRAVAFDKTGTLTSGSLEVAEVAALGRSSAREVLMLAASAVQQVPHPLDRALVREAERLGLDTYEAENVRALPGRGVVATVRGRRVLVGNRHLIEQETGVALPPEMVRTLEEMAGKGMTPCMVWIDDAPGAIIGFRDSLRSGSAAAMRSLRRLGIEHIAMLSGDAHSAAAAVAARLEIDEVHAELLPEEKVRRVEDLVRRYQVVAMVGDGVNDAPAMARATLGIATGASLSDVALETSDVAILSHELARLPYAVALGRASRRVLRQNLALSLGVIAILAPLAALGLAGIPLTILLHEGSTLAVVLNALRLLTFEAGEAL